MIRHRLQVYRRDDPEVQEISDDSGEWVRYKDHASRMQKCQEEIKTLILEKDLYEKALERIKELEQQLAAEREANRWIPVSERLPAVSGNYLTNASHWITAHELVFTVKTKQWWDSTNQEYVEPTHWRELPKFYQEISS